MGQLAEGAQAHATVVADGGCMVDHELKAYPTMKDVASEKYRNGLQVVRGGRTEVRGRRRGPRRRTAAELVLDNRMHTAAVAVQGVAGTTPSIGWEDIRRCRQHPWRVIARRIVEAHAAGAPMSAVLELVRTLESWVEQLYRTDGETVTEHITGITAITFYQNANVA